MNSLLTAALLGTLLFPSPAPFSPGATESVRSQARVPAEETSAVWPLEPEPEVVAGFAPPSERWSAGHRGVDLLGAAGARVRAAVAGTVTFAGTVAGRGVVVVGHGASRTTYEPVEPTVRRGEDVAAGATIGTLQSGLSHCAPRVCLHWGLIEDDEYRDPLSLLGGGRIRLLPLDADHARG
jgi:murein DD-endopeptidase MepM/ murein hydrolase activator NlpD